MQQNFTTTKNNHRKPPLPPPLSVSLPPSQPDPPPPHPQTRPDPTSESPHSPLRGHSPALSDDVVSPTKSKYDTALVPVEKFYSPLNSPFPITPPKDSLTPGNSTVGPPHPIIHLNRREDVAPANSGVVDGGSAGGERRTWRSRGGGEGGRVEVMEKVAVGVRVMEIVLCLISFSVMAADKTQGWSGDSFDRYKEYRFCLTVAIFGFVYSAFQAYDLGSHLATRKHVITHHLRYQFDFIMDQILAYLLISASSAAASRVDDWQSNWGKDEFTEKASASISMAFLAFVCFAMSSLISGYNLCNRDLY